MMIRLGLVSILLGLGIISATSQVYIVEIPDPAFLNALIIEGVDMNGDNLVDTIDLMFFSEDFSRTDCTF